MKHSIVLLLLFSVFFLGAPIKSGFGKEIHEACAFKDAIYSPKAEDRKSEYYFELKLDKNHPAPVRHYYFNFGLYRESSNKLLSSLRLGDVCSNGVSVCRASAYYGQYNDMSNLKEFEHGDFALEYMMLNKDFSRYYSQKTEIKAPYAIVFMNTASEFYYKMSLLKPAAPKENDNYPFIKYFEKNAPIPVFSGSDIWVFKECKI